MIWWALRNLWILCACFSSDFWDWCVFFRFRRQTLCRWEPCSLRLFLGFRIFFYVAFVRGSAPSREPARGGEAAAEGLAATLPLVWRCFSVVGFELTRCSAYFETDFRKKFLYFFLQHRMTKIIWNILKTAARLITAFKGTRPWWSVPLAYKSYRCLSCNRNLETVRPRPNGMSFNSFMSLPLRRRFVHASQSAVPYFFLKKFIFFLNQVRGKQM